MRILISILFGIHSFLAIADHAFTLTCNQNVFIPGQELWFGLIFEPSLKNKVSGAYPTVYISIKDINQNSIQRNAVISKDPYFTSSYTIPFGLGAGTYILEATVYNSTLQQILEEQAMVIQVLGNEKGSYFNFEFAANDTKLISVPAETIKTNTSTQKIRNRICFEEKSGTLSNTEFYSISNTTYLLSCKKSIYVNTSVNNMLYGHVQRVKLDNPYPMPGFYDSDLKQMFQLKTTDVVGEYLLMLPEDVKSKNVQYLDLITSTSIDRVHDAYPEPKWKNSKLQPFIIDEKTLKLNLEKAEIISRLFKQHEQKREIKSSKQTTIPSDNFIETKNYQLFQSTDLFLTEALEPIRINKTKNGNYTVRLMRTDRKEFYESSPLLIINDVVMSSIQPLLQLPYNEIESLAFYRKINETRKSFGPQARFGVIEVKTKPSYQLKKPALPLAGTINYTLYPRNSKQYESGDSQPWFYSVQYLGKSTENPFCYTHNDEKGTFLFQRYSGTHLTEEKLIQVE